MIGRLSQRLSGRKSVNADGATAVSKDESARAFVESQTDDSISIGYNLPEKYKEKLVMVAVSIPRLEEEMEKAQPKRGANGVRANLKGVELLEEMKRKTKIEKRVFSEIQELFGLRTTPCFTLMAFRETSTPDEDRFAPLSSGFQPTRVGGRDGIITLSHLPPDTELNIYFYFNVSMEGSDNPRLHYAPKYTIFVGKVKTNKPEWVIVLEQNGLSSLTGLFLRQRLTSYEAWAQIVDNKQALEKYGIDQHSAAKLGKILAKRGFITADEKRSLEKQREGLLVTVRELISEAPKGFYRGQLVTSEHDSGVVVKVDKNHLMVRFGKNDAPERVAKEDVKPGKWNLFLSHAQLEAQNQVSNLHMLLWEKGIRSWYDMDAEELHTCDMFNGVKDADFFCVYLTKSYCERYFCRLEASVAMQLKKKLLVVYESDPRHGGTSDYVELVNMATHKYPEYRDWLLSTEAMPMARRVFQRKGMIQELCTRCGVVPEISSSNENIQSGTEAELREEISSLQEEVTTLWSVVDKLQQEMETMKKTCRS
uniref:TIR domain-containing protein n=1 Tax=Mucochytrium quahogii TaxID=96639 RepID=A0A7S2WIR9_9STRA|mmetsp:Transcript_12556/g.22792  ORF Transcript_12556/g.22792 Transcript_12556/m.22792 type:complete len:537 (-) Transcript_12556:166-1776(-)